jgi:hypothetical protein
VSSWRTSSSSRPAGIGVRHATRRGHARRGASSHAAFRCDFVTRNHAESRASACEVGARAVVVERGRAWGVGGGQNVGVPFQSEVSVATPTAAPMHAQKGRRSPVPSSPEEGAK